MCNKVSFDNKEDAKKEAKQIKVDAKFRSKWNNKGKGKSKKLYPYKCNICFHWHLTSLSKQITRNFRKT